MYDKSNDENILDENILDENIIIYYSCLDNGESDSLIEYLIDNLSEDTYDRDDFRISIDYDTFVNFLYDRLVVGVREEKEKFEELQERNEQELKKLQKLNANLLRISRERANADRGIKPKKQSSGFKLMSFCSRYEKVRKPNGKIENVLVYKTVYQTPFNNQWLYSDVINIVWNDLPFPFDYRTRNGYNAINDIFHEDIIGKQYIYRWTLRLNNSFSDKMSYWEIELNHTQPNDMLCVSLS